MDTEKITIDIPMLEEGEKKETKKRRNALPSVVAAVFAAISLVLHTAMAAEAIEYIKAEGSSALFSVLIPEYEISEPLIPPLPEGSELRDTSDTQGNTPDKQAAFKIRESDLSANAEYGLALTNETSYTPDLYQLLGMERTTLTSGELEAKYGKDCPKVLIYHTHATESYAAYSGTGFRTSDTENNMIAVGKVIKTVLEKAGIETIHLTEQFDLENWSDAYDNSNAAVLQVLKDNPSIQYVFDIHRDCIGNESEGYVRAATSIYGKDVAQLMFVCGTDEGGSSHTGWRSNLSAALQLQSSIFESYPSLMRPVNLRRASFYQDTSPASLILECGTCAGTIDEAKRAAVLFAKGLCDYILGSDCGLDCEELILSLCP